MGLKGVDWFRIWPFMADRKINFSFELTALLEIPMAFYGTVCMDINYRRLLNQYYVLFRIKT